MLRYDLDMRIWVLRHEFNDLAPFAFPPVTEARLYDWVVEFVKSLELSPIRFVRFLSLRDDLNHQDIDP